MQESDESKKQESSKDGPHDATHTDLLLVANEGCGYDVRYEQEVDQQVEGEVSDRVLVLLQEVLAPELRWTIEQLKRETRGKTATKDHNWKSLSEATLLLITFLR